MNESQCKTLKEKPMTDFIRSSSIDVISRTFPVDSEDKSIAMIGKELLREAKEFMKPDWRTLDVWILNKYAELCLEHENIFIDLLMKKEMELNSDTSWQKEYAKFWRKCECGCFMPESLVTCIKCGRKYTDTEVNK